MLQRAFGVWVLCSGATGNVRALFSVVGFCRVLPPTVMMGHPPCSWCWKPREASEVGCATWPRIGAVSVPCSALPVTPFQSCPLPFLLLHTHPGPSARLHRWALGWGWLLSPHIFRGAANCHRADSCGDSDLPGRPCCVLCKVAYSEWRCEEKWLHY